LVGMASPLVPDALWAEIEPLLPAARPRPQGGRPPVSNRAALTGILFVLKSGIPWEMLPQEMGCGSGMTGWRRLRDWQQAGVWAKLHRALLDRLGRANAIDWRRCALDSASVPAKRGASRPARTRPIAAKPAASAMSWSMPMASRSPWR
jgi:transposase